MGDWRMIGYATTVLGLFAGGALAQPLYLGEQEVDTADSDAVTAVLSRCETLAQEAPDLAAVTRFTDMAAALQDGRGEGDAGGQDPANGAQNAPGAQESAWDELGSMPVSLDPGAVASGDEASGEESDADEEGDDEAEEEQDDLDLDVITLEACKAAGLLF